ncbi:hypothetical protein NQ318_005600 [Aromia moschata]|uniref:Timeless n=1 Tax=Aromia moschata TaxID=1265417 RepID=A0AAV8XTS4_9CUCU|nr:hypothetical protein NQ318_005600 [Aromia moschata]
MAWITSNPVHSTFASLCIQNGDTFNINDNCLPILEEILRKLATEDCTLHTFRRAIGFGQNIRKNLIPLLLYVKDDKRIADATRIIDTTIKILVNLTIPVEYVLPVKVMSRTDVGNQTILELNKLLTTSKEAFTDSRSTKAIVEHMKYLIENDSELSLEQCENINNCLLLLRNILHIPENKTLNSNCVTHSSMQNQIIWNLFTQSIDKIIIYLMSCPQKIYWSVTIVQLIALMYKDQHVGTLQKLLNLWLEASYSESSEDNESNTSPPPDQVSDDSSPIITSDPTSDSSDNGANDRNKHNTKNNTNSERNKVIATDTVRNAQNRSKALIVMKRNKSIETETSTSSGISSMGQSMESNELPPHCQAQTNCADMSGKMINTMCPSAQSEISDCGYVTQVENQESISTSSNDDDQPHQKPVHQKPHSFQKIRYNTGKNRAATALETKELRRKKLVKRSKTNIINMKGLMHHLPTDEDIANILKEFTVDFLLKGYGTLVNDLHAQLLTNIHFHIDTSHFFWLVVTAIREFLQGIETYQKMIHLSDNDREQLLKLQQQIRKMDDLKMLFVLLLRQYNPNIQSRQYLQDLILTNHGFLLFLDNASTTQDQHLKMLKHLKQFATVEIMRQYGLLLENFKENGEFVNNCIFTMMHHIAGDLKNVPKLFQPSILKTLSQIWETDYELCDDWSDLIEYVIHKFINTPGTHCVDVNITPTSNDHVQDLKESDQSSSADSDGKSEYLVLSNPEEFKNDGNIMEPTIYYFTLLNLPVPIIPWTSEQTCVLKHQSFMLLLQKLGLYIPAETGKMFVRIPNFWSADYIFSVAQQLGPLTQANLKFDISKLNGSKRFDLSETKSQNPSSIYDLEKFAVVGFNQTPSIVRYTPLTNQLSVEIPDVDIVPCNASPPELAIAHKTESKRKNLLINMECYPIQEQTDPIPIDDLERNSICDTASVASDLTRMYVSDEEDKILIAENTTKVT